MLSFILSCAAAWIIFKLLNLLFDRKPKIKPGDFIKEIDGQLYLVRETEQALVQPHGRPNLKVVK